MFPILVAILLYQIWVGLTGWISFRPETRFGEHFEGHTCLFSQPDPSHVYTKIDMLFTLKMGKVLKNHSFRKNMEHSQKIFFQLFSVLIEEEESGLDFLASTASLLQPIEMNKSTNNSENNKGNLFNEQNSNNNKMRHSNFTK